MKGVVGEIINSIGATLIVLIILLVTLSGVANVFNDKRGETALAIMGLRNTIVHTSLAENGFAIYNTPENEKYAVEIAGSDISVKYADDGIGLANSQPRLKMSHYTADLKPATLIGSSFCVIKKKDPDIGCEPFVEVCVKGAACCNAAFEESVC